MILVFSARTHLTADCAPLRHGEGDADDLPAETYLEK
jgi:hypothetical protein